MKKEQLEALLAVNVGQDHTIAFSIETRRYIFEKIWKELQ
jgi:hypothetical protein